MTSPALLLVATTLLAPLTVSVVDAAVPCNSTHIQCEEFLWKGSLCRDGYCTNPFQGGCLKAMLQSDDYVSDTEKDKNLDEKNNKVELLRKRALATLRACNSEDPPDAVEKG